MHFDTTTATAERIQINLDGDTLIAFGDFVADGGHGFTSSGFVQRHVNGANTNIDTSTDWLDPRTSFTPADWQVRGTYASYNASLGNAVEIGNAFVPLPVGTVGSWYTLDSSRRFHWRVATSYSPRYAIITVRFEIRNQNDGSFNTLTSAEDAAPIAAFGFYTSNIEAAGTA